MGKQRYKIKDKWLQMYPSLVKPSGGHLEDSDQNPSPKRENSEDIKRENSESIALIDEQKKSSSKTECQEDIYDEDNDKDTGIEWVDDEAQRDKKYDYHEDYRYRQRKDRQNESNSRGYRNEHLGGVG